MTFAVSHLRGAVLFANGTCPPRFTAVHPAVLYRIDGLNMLRAAAGIDMAPMVDVLACKSVQSLKDKAVHLPQPAVDSDMAVAVAVLGPRPHPAVTNNRKPIVEPDEFAVCEHRRSIQIPGFIASSGSVHESAVPKGDAQ